MSFASKDTRQRAITAYKTGLYTQAQVAAMFGVHYKTIFNCLQMDGSPPLLTSYSSLCQIVGKKQATA